MVRKQRESAEVVWRDRLARFERSNLRVKEFCIQEGISDPAFYQWRKRLTKRQPRKPGRESGAKEPIVTESFVPVTVSPSAFTEVEFPNGVRVRVPATNAEALRIALTTGNEVCQEAR